MRNNYPIAINDLKDYVYWWNRQYPFDRWWREKHRIPFQSEQHLKASPIDQRIEYEEEIIFRKLPQIQKQKKRAAEEAEISGHFLYKRSVMQNAQLDKVVADQLFDDFDIGEYYTESGQLKQEIDDEQHDE